MFSRRYFGVAAPKVGEYDATNTWMKHDMAYAKSEANGSTIRKILNRVSRFVFSNSARAAASILLPVVLNDVPLSFAYLFSLISELASASLPARSIPARLHHTGASPVTASDSRTRTEGDATAEVRRIFGCGGTRTRPATAANLGEETPCILLSGKRLRFAITVRADGSHSHAVRKGRV